LVQGVAYSGMEFPREDGDALICRMPMCGIFVASGQFQPDGTDAVLGWIAFHFTSAKLAAIYSRVGVILERSTLADWVGQSSALLRPLVDALEQHVMAGDRG
jgi:hypothetical protein